MPRTTAKMVKQFYASDEIGKSMQEQNIMSLLTLKARRFIFGNNRYGVNLKEAYLSFKEQNPRKFLGFSNPAQLQAKTLFVACSKRHPRSLCMYHSSEREICDFKRKTIRSASNTSKKLFLLFVQNYL
jgi:hypothetical protein